MSKDSVLMCSHFVHFLTDILSSNTTNPTRERNASSVTCVRMPRPQQSTWNLTCWFTLSRNLISVISVTRYDETKLVFHIIFTIIVLCLLAHNTIMKFGGCYYCVISQLAHSHLWIFLLQAFRQKQLLKRHQNLYHNPAYIPPMPREKTQECPECGKAFRHKGLFPLLF